jgi:hypothetical protein
MNNPIYNEKRRNDWAAPPPRSPLRLAARARARGVCGVGPLKPPFQKILRRGDRMRVARWSLGQMDRDVEPLP